MRLRGAVLATAVLGAALAAVGVSAAGASGAAGSTGAAGSAGASGNPLVTIRAIDRAGKPVAVTASLQSLVITGGVDDTLTSAHPTRVPPGTYNIAAWVWEPGKTAATLVDREVKVTANVTVTFDARPGRLIRFTVNDATVTQDYVAAEPFAPDGYDAFDGSRATPAGATYAVPGPLPPGYYLYLEAAMIRPHADLSPVEYRLVRLIKGAIPTDLTFASDRAELASDDVTLRAVDPGGVGGVGFAALAPNAPYDLPSGVVGQWATPPFSVEFYFTPGYEWQACVFYGPQGCDIDDLNNLPVFGVHHYAQTFGSAVFGPSPQVGAVVSGNQLQVGTDGGGLLVDPTQELDTSYGLPVSAEQTWLYEGKKLLARGSGDVSATISAAPHWYTMRIQASRGAGATLSRSVALYYNFRTQAGDDSPDAFWPRVIPSGLSERNAARGGTRTTVPIWFSDLGGNIVVHGVKAWVSVNGGTTWRALRVTGSGDRWTVVVANPAKAGYVSLRVQGTDPAGDTVAVTTVDAYAVS